MLEKLSTPDLIDHARDDPAANSLVIELTERLTAAMGEIDLLIEDLQRWRAIDGDDS